MLFKLNSELPYGIFTPGVPTVLTVVLHPNGVHTEGNANMYEPLRKVCIFKQKQNAPGQAHSHASMQDLTCLNSKYNSLDNTDNRILMV